MSTFYLDFANGNDASDGTTWANAWKTITSGATAARIAPGDTIRIAKSPAPYSIGNATWTNQSKTVTLATAQTATIDTCETAWTASTNVTCNTDTTYFKQGTKSVYSLLAAGFTTGKASYRATGTLDLSSYQKISLWVRTNSSVTAGYLKICLCSDTTGDTIVDEFVLPATQSSQLTSMTLSRTGGGNLGSAIQSIALYVVTDYGASQIYFDNIIACTSTGLNLNSVISKNTAEYDGTEPWWPIQSIVGTTVLIDNTNDTTAAAGRGYYGTSETAATYARECIDLAYNTNTGTTAYNTVQDSGTSGNLITFSGGWNTSNTTQDGETLLNLHNGQGYIVISGKNYVKFERMGVLRGGLLALDTNATNITASYCRTIGGKEIVYCNGAQYVYVDNSHSTNSSGGAVTQASSSTDRYVFIDTLYTYGGGTAFGPQRYVECKNVKVCNYGVTGLITQAGSHNKFINCESKYNAAYGLSIGAGNYHRFVNFITSNNTSGGILCASDVRDVVLYNPTISESTEVFVASSLTDNAYIGACVKSVKHDTTANNHWQFFYGMTINSMANDRVGGSGLKWKYAITSSDRILAQIPDYTPISTFPVTANVQVVFTCYCIKDHATNVGARIILKGMQIAGVDNDVIATKADDTNWEQLTLTFTPTESGVVTVEGQVYYVAGNSNAYFSDINIQ